jgi:hypothetical protein
MEVILIAKGDFALLGAAVPAFAARSRSATGTPGPPPA